MKIFGNISNVKLNEADKSFDYNILPIGKFYDPRYDWLEFTEERLKGMAKNFADGFPPYKPPINVEHESWNGKFGDITEVWYDNGLMIKVVCSEEGWKLVQEKKFQYMSAEFNDYFDKTKGVSIGETLTGAALTNKPANPYVDMIQLSELSEEEINKFKKKEGAADMTELERLQKELADEKARNKKLSDESRKNSVELKKKEWAEKGVPKAVIDRAEKYMFGETADGGIKLSDGAVKNLSDIISDILDAVPKVDFKQHGEEKKTTLTEEEAEEKLFNDALDEITGGKK